MENAADRLSPAELPKVVVCVDTSRCAATIMPHAKAVAAAVNAQLVLVHVLEPHETQYVPIDPVEWEFCRREAEAFVSALSRQHSSPGQEISTQVLQGRLSDQIAISVTSDHNDIAVMCRSGEDEPGRLGESARGVLERVGSSVFMIPPRYEYEETPLYRRVLLPLDGSAMAESAIGVAKKIAHDQGAEIILLHAVEEPFLIEVGPLETEDIALKNRLLRRNERVAHDYLTRKCEQIRNCGIAARPVVSVSGDIRRQLNRAIAQQSADLVVISSHATGNHADASSGDIASFLLANSTVPVLMLRQARNTRGSHVHVPTQSDGVRPPNGTR